MGTRNERSREASSSPEMVAVPSPLRCGPSQQMTLHFPATEVWSQGIRWINGTRIKHFRLRLGQLPLCPIPPTCLKEKSVCVDAIIRLLCEVLLFWIEEVKGQGVNGYLVLSCKFCEAPVVKACVK